MRTCSAERFMGHSPHGMHAISGTTLGEVLRRRCGFLSVRPYAFMSGLSLHDAISHFGEDGFGLPHPYPVRGWVRATAPLPCTPPPHHPTATLPPSRAAPPAAASSPAPAAPA